MPVAVVTEGDVWAPTHTFSFYLPFVTMCAYTGSSWACAWAYTCNVGFEWADCIPSIIVGAMLAFVLSPYPVAAGMRAGHHELAGDEPLLSRVHPSCPRLPTASQSVQILPHSLDRAIIVVFSFYFFLLYFLRSLFLSIVPTT
ncbi:hypothetical protein BDV09DRAFT_23656 [Aspergillus tetrazonus]